MGVSDFFALWGRCVRVTSEGNLRLGALVFILTLGAVAVGAQSIRFEHYSGELAHPLSVVPPWRDGGRLIIDFPERLEAGQSGSVSLIHDGDRDLRGEWLISPDGSSVALVQKLKLRGVRIEVTGQVVRQEIIRFTVELINNTKHPLVMATPLFYYRCAKLSGFGPGDYTTNDPFPNFERPNGFSKAPVVRIFEIPTRDARFRDKGAGRGGRAQFDRMFVVGREERSEPPVDAAISVLTSLDGRRKLVLAWTPGKNAPSDAHTPSVHVDSCFGTIPPRDSARARGLLLLTERPLEPEMLWLSRPSRDIARITRTQ